MITNIQRKPDPVQKESIVSISEKEIPVNTPEPAIVANDIPENTYTGRTTKKTVLFTLFTIIILVVIIVLS